MRSSLRIASLLALLSSTLPAEEKSASAVAGSSPDARIAWFGTWESAKREAGRSQRPILLVAAAPFCHGVPGMW